MSVQARQPELDWDELAKHLPFPASYADLYNVPNWRGVDLRPVWSAMQRLNDCWTRAVANHDVKLVEQVTAEERLLLDVALPVSPQAVDPDDEPL